MKKLSLGMTLLCLSAAALCGTVNNTSTAKKALAEAETNLFEEDFEDALDASLASNFELQNGKGLVTVTNSMFDINFTTVESNNYEFEFDAKYNDGCDGTFFIHLLGLDGTAASSMYIAIEGNGAYLSMRSAGGTPGEIYNNGGDFYGGLDYNQVDIASGAHFKIVHYEGYVELWANGTRRWVTHLSQFGSTTYQSYNRSEIAEGKITGLAFHVVNERSLLLDNIKIKEAKVRTGSYYTTNPNAEKYSILGASALDLAYDNFKLDVNFSVNDVAKSNTYPTIKLVGLNGELFGHNVESAFNFQFYDDNVYLTPQLYVRDSADTWANSWSPAFENTVGETFTYSIEVSGNDIKTYRNDQLCMSTSFSELGVKKGHLQYIMVRPAESGYSWLDATFTGFDKAAGTSVRTDRSEYTSGVPVVATATVFGDRSQTYTWFVDNVDTEISELTHTFTDLSIGEHTIEYKNANFGSSPVTILIKDGIINVTANTTSIYKDESVELSATYEGDFTGLTTKWFVDGEESSLEGDNVTLSGLSVGDHVVYAKAGNIKSADITITVKESEISISSAKSAYNKEDTAVVTATTKGFGENPSIKWYIDGTEVSDNNTNTLNVDMSQYNNGQQIIVKAAVGETLSNEFVLTIYYDIPSVLMNDETYQVLSEMVIDPAKTYGNFLVGSEDGENYLYADPNTVGPYCPIEGKMPTQNAYTYEYKLYVPEELPNEYYVYPCLVGANSKYPTASMEVAFAINNNGMRPYIKDQGSNTNYDDASGAVIADYSFDEGCAKKGDWNHVVFAVQNKSVAVALNGTPVLFFTLPSITVPTGLSMNWWSSADGRNVPLKVKDIKIGGLVEPAPDLESITVSSSAIECKVGETVTYNAVINPFNAEVEAFEWYVNGVKQDETSKTFTFTPTEAGTYTIVCKVGGITSAEKTLTVTTAVEDKPANEGCSSCGNASVNIVTVLSLVTLLSFVVLKKKKGE